MGHLGLYLKSNKDGSHSMNFLFVCLFVFPCLSLVLFLFGNFHAKTTLFTYAMRLPLFSKSLLEFDVH